ncbi:hypothetical protein [Blastococcus sp. SYSU D01042]
MRPGTVLGTAVVLAPLLAVLGLVLWAGGGRAPFGDDADELVERAVRAAGLQVCSTAEDDEGWSAGAVSGRAHAVAADCPGDAATVVVDRFGSAAGRDAAARRFESQVRPRGSGAVLTLGDGTVLLQGAGDGEVRERLVPALRAQGAR